MPNEVIDRVHKMSRRKTNGLDFTDRNGDPYADDRPDDASTSSDDSSYAPSKNSDGNSSDDTVSFDDSSYVSNEEYESDTDVSIDDNSHRDEDSDGSIAGVGHANNGNVNDC